LAAALDWPAGETLDKSNARTCIKSPHRCGLAVGDLSKDDLKEIILQATAYCGAPARNHAMQQAEVAFKEMAKPTPP
jgi:alkylhydroperoxidase/carboxymuconolactone decarboxylase family protein YurZ